MLLPPETLARIKDDTERGDRDRHVYVDHCAVLLAAVNEAIKRGSVLDPDAGLNEPNLGLATTRELLDEIRARIEVDYASGGGGLDYTTVHGRPDLVAPTG